MRGLIFGTTYCDTDEKLAMTRLWVRLHRQINPDCDLALVDSASIKSPSLDPTVLVIQFGDNVGHLARGGQDGWGRAFCRGLRHAIDDGYDYAAHVEGDSLFRLPLKQAFEDMRDPVVSVPVIGTKRVEKEWVETGLMLFSVDWLKRSQLIEQYNWKDGASKKYPNTPERVMYDLVSPVLHMMSWNAERGDRGQINPNNVDQYDWITHVDHATATAFCRSAQSLVSRAA